MDSVGVSVLVCTVVCLVRQSCVGRVDLRPLQDGLHLSLADFWTQAPAPLIAG